MTPPHRQNTLIMLRAEQERIERILRGQDSLMQEVHGILEQEQKTDDILRAKVRSASPSRTNLIAPMDPSRVFHVDTLKAACIKYRLRFLDASLFKGDLPPQAVLALRGTERLAAAPLQGFKMLAPASRFKLCDSNADPLLFVPVGDDRYYLVHRWGNDMAPWRAWTAWPFRSAFHLGVMVLACSLVLSLFIPNSVITSDPSATWMGAHRVLFLFWSTMVCISFTVFGWLAFFGSFSRDNWNSRHFN
jgi:hypothetical protein